MSLAEPEEPQDAIEVGLWCNRCFLPSVARWPHGEGTVDYCIDCESYVDEEGFPVS